MEIKTTNLTIIVFSPQGVPHYEIMKRGIDIEIVDGYIALLRFLGYKCKIDDGVTSSERPKTSIFVFVQTQNVLCQTKSILCQTKSILCQTKNVLCRIKSVLFQNKNVLCQTKNVLCRIKSVLFQNKNDLFHNKNVLCRIKNVLCLNKNVNDATLHS